MRSRSRATVTAARRSAPSPWAVRSAMPGPSGSPAIEALTAAGVNVNVTLLFSVERYEQVIEAYIRGPRATPGDRAAAGLARVGRVVLRVACRRQGRRAAARRLGSAWSRRRRQRAACIRALAPALRRRPLAQAGRRRRAQPATAVGEHRDQGPGLLRRALRRAADRTRSHQHDARGDLARIRRSWRRRPCPCLRRGRRGGDPARRRGRGHRPSNPHRRARARRRARRLRLLAASRSGVFAGASSNPIGIPPEAQQRWSRKPQKKRLCERQWP
jgi:transaldolase/fructose-6-phosphate aldolase-like protein